MTDLLIGGVSFKVHDVAVDKNPRYVRELLKVLAKLPDGQLVTTRQLFKLSGYSDKKSGAITQPSLEPYYLKHSYHLTFWGNKRTIQRAKKAQKQSS